MEIKVSGMHCDGCAQAVRRSVSAAAPKARVRVNLAAGRVTVEGEAERKPVVAAIERAGYTVEG